MLGEDEKVANGQVSRLFSVFMTRSKSLSSLVRRRPMTDDR